jgi:hypothetical protein
MCTALLARAMHSQRLEPLWFRVGAVLSGTRRSRRP